jgi:nucleotide-binding universal stress UspA family protein
MASARARACTPTTLVVALDGSVFADAALRPAVALAARSAATRVLLVTACPDDPEGARRHLTERAARFSATVDVDTEVISGSSPADAIAEVAQRAPGSVLCLATHGHGGLRTALLGSVAEDLVCRGETPILLIGPRCRTAPLPDEAGDLVVTSDGSALSEAVLPHADAWAGAFGLTPVLVEVVGPDELLGGLDEPATNRQVEAGTKRLAALASHVSADERPARIQVLHGADVARSITSYAERLPAVVVAMATHGAAGIARSLMGSVTSGVVRRSPCPVLLVRPSEAGRCG